MGLVVMRRSGVNLYGRIGGLTLFVQILQSIVTKAKALEKAAYIISIDHETSKVAHINVVPKARVSKEFDAKTWAAVVTTLIGGKVSLASP